MLSDVDSDPNLKYEQIGSKEEPTQADSQDVPNEIHGRDENENEETIIIGMEFSIFLRELQRILMTRQVSGQRMSLLVSDDYLLAFTLPCSTVVTSGEPKTSLFRQTMTTLNGENQFHCETFDLPFTRVLTVVPVRLISRLPFVLYYTRPSSFSPC